MDSLRGRVAHGICFDPAAIGLEGEYPPAVQALALVTVFCAQVRALSRSLGLDPDAQPHLVKMTLTKCVRVLHTMPSRNPVWHYVLAGGGAVLARICNSTPITSAGAGSVVWATSSSRARNSAAARSPIRTRSCQMVVSEGT